MKKKKITTGKRGRSGYGSCTTPPPAIFRVLVATRSARGYRPPRRHFHTMNKFPSINAATHSHTQLLAADVARNSAKRGLEQARVHPSLSISFSLGNMISGDDDADRVRWWRGGSVFTKRRNIQSGRDNKGGTKDSSGWQDAPGASLLLLCRREWLSCSEGQLESWRIEDGEGGRGPAAITHRGCSHFRAQERDRDGADVTQQ